MRTDAEAVPPLKERLQRFRAERGLSQEGLANLLGVGRITLVRWENGTSKPSPLAANQLVRLGFGKIDPSETKEVSTPRLTLRSHDHRHLVEDIRNSIKLGKGSFRLRPSSYVVNGPQDQLPFFETLYKLQETSRLPCPVEEYVRRLSLVSGVEGFPIIPSQHALEASDDGAKHWNPNYGPHGWHRYVGRFPPHLIRALINHFGARKGETICDPFAGSGTALVEARLLGFRALGVEVCPLSCLISRTKSKFPSTTRGLLRVSQDLTDFFYDRWNGFVLDRDIREIFHGEIFGREGNSIRDFPNSAKWFVPEALLGCSIAVEFALTLRDFERDFVCCALSSAMRSIGNVDVDVVRAEYSRAPRSYVDVLKLVQRKLHRMILDIECTVRTHRDLMASEHDITVFESSVLDAEIAPASLDYIITSPPYGAESVSYLRTHLLSYRCLDPVLHYDPYSFNHKIIGSEYINPPETPDPTRDSTVSKKLASFLKKKTHDGKSMEDRSRRDMMIHFFDDMLKVGRKFREWLRPNGRIAFVIGNKRLGDEVIPADEIIRELFEDCGLRLDRIIRHKLKCNNSNSEVPWQERTIQDEFVLLFTRTPVR